MNKYIYSLLIVSVVGGLINSFISSFGNIKKYVNYFIGILMVICILSPVIGVVNNISYFKNNISEFFNNIVSEEIINNSNEIIINTGTEAIKRGIEKSIIDKFGLNEKEIFVELNFDKSDIESIKITKINITLTGKASWYDADSIKKYLEKMIGGNISVVKR